MFGKIKDFATKKLLERQLRNAPPQQRQMIMTIMEKNPELLTKIAKEIRAEVKKGSSEMSAAMKVMPKYQKELQEAMGKDNLQQGGGARFNPNGTIHR
jgi:primosomal protein N'